MSVNWRVNLEDGRVWFLGAHTIFGEPRHYPNGSTPEHGEIIIPACQLDGLTAQEIGEQVLSLASDARYCFAAHAAHAYCGSQGEYHRNAPPETIEAMIYGDLPLILEFKERDNQAINEAIEFLTAIKADYEARQVGRLTSKETRKSFSKNRDELFLTVGKRDGFHCGACKATKRLHVDHVIPVILGGTNDVNNLQILCGSCNSRKGDKIVDYRERAA